MATKCPKTWNKIWVGRLNPASAYKTGWAGSTPSFGPRILRRFTQAIQDRRKMGFFFRLHNNIWVPIMTHEHSYLMGGDVFHHRIRNNILVDVHIHVRSRPPSIVCNRHTMSRSHDKAAWNLAGPGLSQQFDPLLFKPLYHSVNWQKKSLN